MSRTVSDSRRNGRPKTAHMTPDEIEVIAAVRSTAYGRVVADIKAGRIVGISRTETIKPPSAAAELKSAIEVSVRNGA